MHPRHDVELGSAFPDTANAVIEIPLGSKNKYEVDEDTGLLRLSRVLASSVVYPVSYGFYPRTTASDGMALDAMVYSQTSLRPLTVVETRPLGVITISSKKGREPKIVSVAVKDPVFGKLRTLKELGHRFAELKQFLKDYKELEFDPVKVLGTGDAERARATLRKSSEDYAKSGGRRST